MPLDVPNSKVRTAKPPWLKVKAPGSSKYLETRKIVKDLKLHTVCEEANCPNIGDCWSHKTATFLIMGDHCTRHCSFCAIKDGAPDCLGEPDPLEPERIGAAVKGLNLSHVVITSVTRDDLPDGGASHFAKTVQAIHKEAPECSIELLIPDLQGARNPLKIILQSKIDILNHNLETVPSLYDTIRPLAEYNRSLTLLLRAKGFDPEVFTKSGIMVGLGESRQEILGLMDDLIRHKVDILTIGQYLRPTSGQVPVKAYYTPEDFEELEEIGLRKGFKFVESGALVRSSYHAWKHSPK